MKRFLQIFLTTAIVMMTAFLVTDAVSPSRNYNVVDNIFLHSTSSYDDALYIADEYNLELIEYSEYGYSIYQNTYQDDTYLLSNGFSYDSYSTVDESPWKTTTTEDPYLKNQYGLEVTNTIETWGLTEGSSQVLIAIIDTGIDINHPEFQGRISTLSKNVVTNTVGITAVDDDYGHGTMVAGIIGAIKDNSTGIAGITQNTMLLVLKANETDEGSFKDSSVIAAIYYAIEKGADVINLSLGTSYANPQTEEAVEAAIASGIIVIGAAGNDGTNQLSYPASFDDVISVGAVDESLTIAEYSNYNLALDIAAPGSDIVTTSIGSGYVTGSGTSFAAPHVAGIIALFISYFPDASVDEIKAKLYASAVDLGIPGIDPYYGYGLIDAYALLASNYYKITYVTGAGSYEAPDYVISGSLLDYPATPTLEDQVFVGWYLDTDFTVAFDNNQPITSDLTLYAFFTDAYHNVRFITPGTSVSDIVVANLDTFTLPQTTLSGYRFLGWYLEPDFITLYEVAPVVEDLTLYAKFEQIIYYQVDVYVQDELIESLTVEENTTFDLPDVSVEGYTFQGWYIDAEFSEPYISGEIQSDITLYAYMEINSYTITLNFDGQIDTIIYQYLETPSINEPSKSDYDFAGWYFDPNYQDRYFVEPVTEDLTLYAKFIPLAYVIDLYVLNAYYDSIYIEPDEIPVMPEIIFDGYVFSGWYSDNSYTVLYQPAVLTQDIALYGKYDAIQYLIRFFDGNNQVLSADYLTWNDEINYPDGPDKASTDTFDFVFSHWSTTQKYVNSNLDIYPVYDKIFKPESVTLSLSVDTIYLNQTYQEVSIILKDLSLSVTIESDLNTHETGKYEIRYLIYDGDDLIYTMKRYVRVIDPPQVISISLNPGISTILVGGTYYEAGATSSIGNVVVSGTVDTSIAGTYYVTYEVTYSDQIYSITRVVTVIDPNTGMTDILSYVIYKEEENA